MKWINVKSQLPPSDAPVLVVTERGRICLGIYSVNFQKWYDYEAQQRNDYHSSFNHLTSEVTHWQSLPNVPVSEDATEIYEVKIMKASYSHIRVEAISISDAMQKAQTCIDNNSIEENMILYQEEIKPIHADVAKVVGEVSKNARIQGNTL